MNKKKDLNYYLNLRYLIELIPTPEEDGGGWRAEIPELGRYAFVGDGDTIEEALAQLEEVKRDYFEDWYKKGVEIPEPDSYCVYGEDIIAEENYYRGVKDELFIIVNILKKKREELFSLKEKSKEERIKELEAQINLCNDLIKEIMGETENE